MKNEFNKTTEQVKAAIEELDLSPIKQKLMDKKDKFGWSRKKTNHIENQYKRLLWLMYKYKDAVIVPSKDIDEFWHVHILDTRKYLEDCNNIFGYFVHHNPYLGTNSKEEGDQLRHLFRQTKELYLKEYGTSVLLSDSLFQKCSTANTCGSHCSSDRREKPRMLDSATFPFDTLGH